MGAEGVSYTPGPGDPETWPPFAGNPHDPRTLENDSNDTTEESIFLARIAATSAARAYREGKPKDAERFLVCARDILNELLRLNGSQ